jgi:NADH-quinone oxidoreductase subunit C
LFDHKKNYYLRVKTWVPEDDPVVNTASDVWKSAPWAEREVWDLFGIKFRGHADLRRLVMPYDYSGHPLRKDYPLRGRGERFNFPKITRK